MKKIILSLLAASCISMSARAYDIESDGLYYNYDAETNSAYVTNNGSPYRSFTIIDGKERDMNLYLDVPDSVVYNGRKVAVKGIGEGAFESSLYLRFISLPKTLEYIGARAFKNCASLESIHLPSSVKYVRDEALSGTYVGIICLKDGFDAVEFNPFGDEHAKCTLYLGGSWEKSTSIFAPRDLLFGTTFDTDKYHPENIDEERLDCITSMSTTPKALPAESFSDATYKNVPLHVPYGTKSIYEATDGWKLFSLIEEVDVFEEYLKTQIATTGEHSAIENVTDDNGEACRYNIRGMKLESPAKGINIIKTNNGKARKVMMK